MRHFLFLIAAITLGVNAFSSAIVQDKILGVGGGLGIPQQIGGELHFLIVPKFHLGLSLGVGLLDSASLSPKLDLPEQVEELKTGDLVRINPVMTLSTASITPFIRYFPTDRNFYLQFSYVMAKSRAKVQSGLRTLAGDSIEGALLNGEVNITQIMPTITMGHIFTAEMFYVNLGLGISLLANVSTDNVTWSGEIPNALGGTEGNQSALDSSKSKIESGVNKAQKAFKDEILFIPSFMITIGIVI